MPWRIERLAEAHDRRRFRCGVHSLDNYFRRPWAALSPGKLPAIRIPPFLLVQHAVFRGPG